MLRRMNMKKKLLDKNALLNLGGSNLRKFVNWNMKFFKIENEKN